MHHLMRIVRYAWPYRWRFALSVLCGLAVAILWAANLSTVYPVVTVLFSENDKDRNLQTWIEERIRTSETRLQELAKERTRIERRQQAEPPEEVRQRQNARLAEIDQEVGRVETRLKQERVWEWLIVRFIPDDPFQTLVALLVTLVLLMVLRGVFYFFQETLVGSVTNRTLFDLRNQLFRRALRQDPAAFDEKGTTDIMARFTNDMQSLANGLELIMGRLVREPFRIIACLALACCISWRLTLLTVLVVPLAALVMSQLARRLRRQARLSLESISAFYKILQESFQSIKIVKAFNMERYERHRFFREGKVYYKKVMRTVELDALVSPVTELLGMLVISGTLLIGTYLLLTGKTHLKGIRLVSDPLNTAGLIQFYVALAGLADPCRKLSNLYGRLQRTIAAADRVFAQLDREPQVVDRPQAVFLTRCEGRIEFDHVTFAYPRTVEAVLADFNLTIEPGETVALVGPNGCGKSTLVNLLVRFYDPQGGAIRIDGLDLRQIKMRSLRRHIGLVTQETRLFDDTVFNNIAHGNRHAPQEQVFEAARRAYAHDFILALPDGYETRIGEQGARLSGGQRQRIALARAFLRDPAILILDEATSAIDVESEALIQRALEEFCRGRTTLVISHRLSVLSMVDRIVVLDRGVIVAQGSDAELVQTCPAYRRLRDLYFQEGNHYAGARQPA
ncbi:MAG TPA: ABC transporter transmembrane domain-containing protein [Gemmataceae bacterium]|nr:ABC transporter transmembrane domain-containing protein [Gemmataceae bacterium]